jgi:hypothetical protein
MKSALMKNLRTNHIANIMLHGHNTMSEHTGQTVTVSSRGGGWTNDQSTAEFRSGGGVGGETIEKCFGI